MFRKFSYIFPKLLPNFLKIYQKLFHQALSKFSYVYFIFNIYATFSKN